MTCHAQIWRDSPLLAPVRESLRSGVPLRWNRVHALPDFVAFDHSIHVTKGVGCVTCHGRIDQMAQVEKWAPLSMGWCLDCHRQPERYLRPREEVVSMTWTPGGEDQQLAMGERLKQEYDVHTRTSCTTCHR